MWYFVLGLLFQSLLTCFAVIAFDNEKQNLGLLLAGPVVWLLVCVDVIQKAWKHHYYLSAMIDPHGVPCYCPCHNSYADCLIEIGYQFNVNLRDKYKIEDGWNKRDCVMGVVNLRYTPRKIVKVEGMYKIPKEVLAQAKQNWIKKGY